VFTSPDGSGGQCEKAEDSPRCESADLAAAKHFWSLACELQPEIHMCKDRAWMDKYP
jgi:hypothetical protein